MYTPILNADGSIRGPVDGFAPQLGITTLEEYFNWLPDLKRDIQGNPTKYTILPLDEAHFEINANTRAINIPAEFKKNGIAVQGDDLAEVVYFEIDRYFDTMDLNNCDIYIQWETPKKADGTVKKSISDIYIRDIESKPGKLIFGWAISDAITEAAGNLKFSVKFLQWNEGADGKRTIAYSLNTLTAGITIHQSIGLNLETDKYEIDQVNDRLLERIQESEVVGGLQAATPYFIENIEELSDGYDIVPNHFDGTLKIYAIASADDTGAVTYLWKKRGLKADNSSEEAEYEIINSSTTEMIPVTEINDGYPVLKDKHIYYLEVGNVFTNYSGGYTLDELKALYPDVTKVPTFYEKKAVLEVSEAGIYTVEARNRIFNSISKTRSKSAVFKCPEPVRIDSSKEVANNHIIGENSAVLAPPYDKKPVGDMTFQWYKAPEKPSTRSMYEVDGGLDGTQISYGEDTIRIAYADDAKFVDQNVGAGGDPDKYYFSIKTFAPEDAVYFNEGQDGLNTNPDDIVLEGIKSLADSLSGTDSLGRKYRINWLPAAQKKDGIWTYFGENTTPERFIGWTQKIEWYDKDQKKIGTHFVKIQLSNESSFSEINSFEAIPTGTTETYVASEEGLYKVEMTRTRNRRSISDESIEYRVTSAPEVPKFVTGTFDGATIISVNELKRGEKILSVEMDDRTKYDEYEVVWMLYRGDAEPKQEDIEIYKEHISKDISNFNPTDAHFAPIFEKYGVNLEGRYYARVRTKRNGRYSAYTDAPKANDMFIVTGI